MADRPQPVMLQLPTHRGDLVEYQQDEYPNLAG